MTSSICDGDPLVEHLRGKCVQVMGRRPGGGFYVRDDIVVTCAHVVGQLELGASAPCRLWSSEGPGSLVNAALLAIDHDEDCALLRISFATSEPVRLATEASRVDDPLVGLGFPVKSGREEFDQFSAQFEGSTQYASTLSGRVGREEKFKSGQVEHGFSGGPLLNLRTASVIGVTIASRDTSSALGGWAVGVDVINRMLDAVGPGSLPAFAEWQKVKRLQASVSRADGPGSRLAVPAQAIALTPHFVSRTEITAHVVAKLLTSPEKEERQPIVALYGPGGAGKSTISAAIASMPEILARFPDGVLWSELGTNPALYERVSDWLASVVSGDLPELTIDGCSALLRTTLQHKAMLLVVDNVWEAAHMLPFLVGGPKCRVLITTRRAPVCDAVGSTIVSVEEFTPEQAITLIDRRADVGLEREKVLATAKRLGHMPIAIELLAAMLSRGIPINEIDRQLTYHIAGWTAHASDSRQMLDACFLISLLFMKRRDEVAYSKFILLGLTPAGAALRARNCATIWSVTTEEAESILWRLNNDALIRRNGSEYSIHDLIHGLIRQLLVEPEPRGLGLNLAQQHTELIARYLELAPDRRLDLLPADGYIHRYLVWHATQANDPDFLRDIIGTREPGGAFAWYTARGRLGEQAAFFDDLKVCQNFFSDRSHVSVGSQWLCALIGSSLRSAYSKISPQLLIALAVDDTWSIATTEIFVNSIEDSQTWSRLSVALGSAIAIREKDSKGDEISKSIRKRVMKALAERIHADADSISPEVKGAYVGLMEGDSRISVFKDFFIRISLDHLLERFVAALPADLRSFALKYWWSRVEDGGAVPRIEALSRILALANDEERTSYGEKLVQIISARTDPNNNVSSMKLGPFDSLFKRKLNEKRDGSTSDGSDDGKIFASILDAATACLVSCADEELSSLILVMEKSNRSEEALGRFRESAEREVTRRRLADITPDLPKAIRFALGRKDVERAMTLVGALKTDRFAALGRVIERLASAGPERVCLAWHKTWETLGHPDRIESARILNNVFPESAGVRAYLASLSPNRERFAEPITSILLRLTGDELNCAGILCAAVGLGPLTNMTLLRALKIGDAERQAAAVLALIPYLPRSYNETLLDPWKDSGAFGASIAAYIEIMEVMGRAAQADSLSELIESVTRKDSEWWVVEALTTTLRRLTKIHEFRAILEASTHIGATDLKARLIGRVSRRAADFGFGDFAVNALQQIPSAALRRDEQVEFAQSVASVGNIALARTAAAAIDLPADRSRAFANIAIEMAAQGRFELAKSIAQDDIVDEGFRTYVVGLIGTEVVGGPGQGQAHIEGRSEMRRFNEPTRSELSRAITKARQWAGPSGCLDRIDVALLTGNHDDLHQATSALWVDQPVGEHHLLSRLAAVTRPTLLGRLADMAAFVGAAGGDEVVATIIAVREVGQGWN